MSKPKTPARPRIKLTPEDHERLTGLAATMMERMPDVAGRLADDLDRAQVVTGKKAEGLVRMGSRVEYRDEETGKVQAVTLVYPGEADIGKARVSVMTPVGAALVGLAAGQATGYETRTGAHRRLAVLAVHETEAEPA